MSQKTVALALASGGARGLAHIGVINELESRGFEISAISGSSMGAVVGGMYAAGTLKEYEKWALKLTRFDVLNLMDFTLGSQGFIKGEKLFQEMQKQGFIPDVRIEDLDIPISIVATDIINNKEVTFTNGDLPKALRASVAIPNIITPVKFKGGLLVDGGVLNPLPLSILNTKDASLLVAVDINALIPYSKKEDADSIDHKEHDEKSKFEQLKEKWYELFEGDEKKKLDKLRKLGYIDMFSRTYQIMQNRLTQVSLKTTPPDITIEISKDACGTFEFYRAKEMIELGRKSCAKALNEANL